MKFNESSIEDIEEYESYTCPFCNSTFPLIYATFHSIECYFNVTRPHYSDNSIDNTFKVYTNMYHCPKCNKISVAVRDHNSYIIPIFPNSTAKQFPEYVPKSIREDYEEAYSILSLSPKASATLSRRCLQGMIRDFWDITDDTLYKEISKLQSIIPPTQWKVLQEVRKIGNIGAHMQKDVNLIIDIKPDEAKKLLNLIELLIKQWYIERYEQEQLYNDILDISKNKQSQKKTS